MVTLPSNVVGALLAALTVSTAAVAQSYYDDQTCRQFADAQVAPLRDQANYQAVGNTLLGAGLGAAVGAALAAAGAPGSERPPGRSSAPELVQPTRRMRRGTSSSNTTPITRSAWPLGGLRRRHMPHQDRVMHRRRVMDRPQVTLPSRAIRRRLGTRLGDALFPTGRCKRQSGPHAHLFAAYSAGVGSSPAGMKAARVRQLRL